MSLNHKSFCEEQDICEWRAIYPVGNINSDAHHNWHGFENQWNGARSAVPGG